MKRLKKILISIIIPAYKCKNYIDSCINSILGQTYTDYEIIIIEDCSGDGTYEYIKDKYSSNEKVKLYKNEKNRGVSYTRNYGISKATGEYIAFLDSDDLWTKDKLFKQVQLIINSNAQFVFTGAQFINSDGRKMTGIFEVPNIVNYKKLLKQNVISCSSVLISKKLIGSMKMEHDDAHEDYLLWLRILKQGINAYGINEPLLIYRMSANSKSGNKIKAARMTYKVYKYLGIKIFMRLYYFFCYTIRSLKKYKNIKEESN